VGLLFFVLQGSIVIGTTSDSVVVDQIVGPVGVAQYSVGYKLFAIGVLLWSVWQAPLWPAYREATARGDIAWVRRTLLRSIALSLAASVAVAALLILMGQQLIHLWVGDLVHVPQSLLVGFACWAVLSACGGAFAAYLNAVHIVGFQIVTATAMAAANIILSVYLTYSFGVSGVVWGTVIASTVFSAIPLAILLRLTLQRLSAQLDARGRDQEP
jgi:O-antigen/teichoic acid export membrane protein